MAATEVSLSSKNQIVIPRAAREALRLEAGDKLLVVTLGTQVIIVRKPASHATATRGIGKGLYEDDYLARERGSWRE